ncbi:MAG TPA: hypothetical protein VIO16_12915 [Dehalococcoidia bacterium]
MAELDNPVSLQVCTHRWQIATPVGDQCSGICRLCGVERNFTNERSIFGQPGRSRRPVPPVKAQKPAADTGGLAQFLARAAANAQDGARPL